VVDAATEKKELLKFARVRFKIPDAYVVSLVKDI